MARRESKPLQVHVPEPLHADLVKLANEKGITLSELVRSSLTVYKRLQEAIAQGQTIMLEDEEHPEKKKELLLP